LLLTDVVQLNEEVMDDMEDMLRTGYGVNVNTSASNRKVTNDWDTAQSMVRSASRKFTHH